MAYIEIKDATKWYPHKSGKLRDIFRKDKSFVKAVDGVNLSMDRGDNVKSRGSLIKDK